tara:strand:+ start:3330 stop:3638 length:309 start_codon:yes stop_codon:yes gene_type:complete
MSDLFNYPYSPSKGKTDTSEQAADALITPDTWRARVFDTFKKAAAGLTADEVAIILNKNKDLGILTIRPRVTELVKQDMIEDSGIRRKNNSGRNAIVWRVKT